MTFKDQTLALAGVFQSAALVKDLARRGRADNDAVDCSINSLFVREPDAALDVFGSVGGLATGLGCLRVNLDNEHHTADREITAYVINLLHLAGKAYGRKKVMQGISDELEQLERHQLQTFSAVHPNVLSRLAAIYQDTIGKLGPRIMVRGEPVYLQNPEHAARIRALLLAGVRAAILWRQLGGSRVKMVLKRKSLIREAEALLA